MMSMSHCPSPGVPVDVAVRGGPADARNAAAALGSMWIADSTGCAIATVRMAATARSVTANAAARQPTRASARDAAAEPTLDTSIDTTSGITVIRIRLMKRAPTVAAAEINARDVGVGV